MQENLFTKTETRIQAPLADRVRPKKFDDFVGQDELLGENGTLRQLIENDQLISFLLWGPPGSGKTTIAHLTANYSKAYFQSFSAVTSSIKDLRRIISEAELRWKSFEQRTIVFVDEIHHFNKTQQDAFLPYIENGQIIFIGATTENPSFQVNSALLSRLKTFILKNLAFSDLNTILKNSFEKEKKLLQDCNVQLNDETIAYIAKMSYGDARVALNILETGMKLVRFDGEITIEIVNKIIQGNVLYYDKSGEEHYNLISALHKSLRDSDLDASLYWAYRMIKSGEKPLFILRRLVRFASEDVGLADPKALSYATASKDAFEFIGPPEGYLAIMQCVAYLAVAPKSNSLYKAEKLIKQDLKKFGHLPVPYVVRNAPTEFMKEAGYGEDYVYAHDRPGEIIFQQHLPDELENRQYFYPSQQGAEKKISEYLDRIRETKNRMGVKK